MQTIILVAFFFLYVYFYCVYFALHRWSYISISEETLEFCRKKHTKKSYNMHFCVCWIKKSSKNYWHPNSIYMCGWNYSNYLFIILLPIRFCCRRVASWRRRISFVFLYKFMQTRILFMFKSDPRLLTFVSYCRGEVHFEIRR